MSNRISLPLFPLSLLLLLLLLCTITPTTSTSTPYRRATICNGHSELCNRSYGNITFIGAHDSYAVGNSLADNQNKNITEALNDGIRMLQVQAHNTTSGIHLCHTSCVLLDGGSFTSYLTTLKSWLDGNPNEVVSILIVNSDNLPATNFITPFTDSEIIKSVYTPTSATININNWPTLGEMIDSGGRVVVMMDAEADFNSVPWLIDEFSNMWEDAYDVTSQDFACAVNRTAGSPSTTLYLTNHFLDTYGSVFGFTTFLPNKALLNETNAATGLGSIGQGVDNCVSLWSRPPNHILLDFYDTTGNTPFDVAATLNGVSAPTNTVIPASSTASTSSSTASVTTKSLSGARSTLSRDGIWLGSIAIAVTVVASMIW